MNREEAEMHCDAGQNLKRNKHQQRTCQLFKIFSQSVDDARFLYAPRRLRRCCLEKYQREAAHLQKLGRPYPEHQDDGAQAAFRNALYENGKNWNWMALVDWHQKEQCGNALGAAAS